MSDAVAARRAGYAVVVLHSDDHIAIREPKLIRLGEVLPTDKIDLSAAPWCSTRAMPSGFLTMRPALHVSARSLQHHS